MPGNLERFKRAGYEMVGHFTLPLEAWTVNFYGPMEKRLEELEAKYSDIPEAMEVYSTQRKEIEELKRFHEYVGYEVFVARKPE